jgi:ribosomal protein L21E
MSRSRSKGSQSKERRRFINGLIKQGGTVTLLPPAEFKIGDRVRIRLTRAGDWEPDDSRAFNGKTGVVLFVDNEEEPRYNVLVGGLKLDLSSKDIVGGESYEVRLPTGL